MESLNKIVVVLLIVAIVFSVASIYLNLSIAGFEAVQFSFADSPSGVSGSGNIGVTVTPSRASG